MSFTVNDVTSALQTAAPYAGLIASMIGLSAIQQKVKNWLELEDPKVLVLLTTTFSLAAAIVPAALGYLSANPYAIGTHTAMIFTGMTLAFRYVIQPGSSKLNSFKADRANYIAFKTSNQSSAQVVAPTVTPSEPVQNPNVFQG